MKLNWRDAGAPRVLPALIVTLGVLLSLKAAALAADVSAAQTESETQAATSAPAPAPAKGQESGGVEAAATPAVAPAAQQCEPGMAAAAGLSASEMQILQSLGERRKTLDTRAAELDTRTELLAAAERRLEDRIAEMKRIETRVQELLGQADQEQDKRLAGLVDVYQRMRAKDAAEVFNALEDDVLLQVASRMKQQNLAEIMGAMDPARARALTRLMAQSRTISPSDIARAPAARAPTQAARN
jgi:flagellar motility protein MotE (MotC chaperone)